MRRRNVLGLTASLAAVHALAGCLAADPDPENGTGDEDDGGNDEDTNGDDENDGDGNGDDDRPNVDEETIAFLTRENRRFAFDLHDELRARDPDENLFYSPHSISLAMAMTYGGARGETADQLAETMHYALGEDVHFANEALAYDLDSRSELEGEGDGDDAADDTRSGSPFELSVANAVWGQDDYPFHEEYLELLETHYGAGLREIDFRADPEGARETINQWVEAETNERIDDLLPAGSISELARLVLTNAIYFQASWETPFDEELTEEATFTALDGSTSTVPMMGRSASLPYAEVDGHQLVELPYVGREIGMVVLLPAEGEFEAFEDGLEVERFDDILDELEHTDGRIALPRFEYDTGFSMKAILSALGMPIAFDPDEADFSGLADVEATDEPLFIHDVFHEAAITVDEAGTEAAAATGVVVGTTSAPADPFEMVVNRPFLFAIRDRPTGALLFLGRVVDAGSAQ